MTPAQTPPLPSVEVSLEAHEPPPSPVAFVLATALGDDNVRTLLEAVWWEVSVSR